MKVLLVIPSKLKTGIEAQVARNNHPTMDYYALAHELQVCGAEVDFLDKTSVAASRLPCDLALAIAAAKDAGKYDAIFTNSESISIPLALLLRARSHRPRHVTIAHKLTSGKKALFFRRLNAHREIDTLFVYAATQRDFGINSLGIDPGKLRLIHFHADEDFFQPTGVPLLVPPQFCSAGLEWRDYPTLVETARLLPDCTFKIAAASPWSKHRNELAGLELPDNVSARLYDYEELRTLYSESIAAIIPLYENDFQAGVTTILEAMSVGKPVIATRTTGQRDVIDDEVTGLYVPPGDPSALTEAVIRLRDDQNLRTKLGENARAWLVQNASLKKWSTTIAKDILTERSV